MKQSIFYPEPIFTSRNPPITHDELRLLMEALSTLLCALCCRSGLDHRDADHVLVDPMNN